MQEVSDQMVGALRSGLYQVHFTHLDDVDGAGHGYGYYAHVPEYVEAVERADALIGEMFEAVLQRADVADEEWLIIVTSDHGGQGYSHGCMDADCQTIPLIIAGPSVGAEELKPWTSSHMDIHPTVIDFLGLDPDDYGLDGVSWIDRERICDDEVDNDGDGLTDCDDPDCGDDIACWECPQEDIASETGTHIWSGEAASGGLISGTCGGDGYETTFAWSAPVDGWYGFDTMNTYEDTVLYVLDGDCEGSELACNDDAGNSRSSLAVELTAGQDVAVVVDAYDPGDAITVILSAYPFDTTCPHGDLGDAAGSWEDAIPETDTVWADGACPPAVGGSMVTWTAPSAGTWTFDTYGSSFDTVLYLLDDCAGDATNLACNDDAGGGYQSEVSALLGAGEEVVVVVGAFDARYGGDYVLNISR